MEKFDTTDSYDKWVLPYLNNDFCMQELLKILIGQLENKIAAEEKIAHVSQDLTKTNELTAVSKHLYEALVLIRKINEIN